MGSRCCISCGTGIAQWLQHWTHDGRVSGSQCCRSSRRIFFSRASFLCWLLFWYPLHPCVTAVACKRSWSFFQKCSWQVTAKHPCTYLCGFEWSNTVNWCKIVWCTQNMCQDGSSFTWHQPCNNQRELWVLYITSVDINNERYKKKGYSHSFRITCNMCTVSLLESRE